MIINKKITEAIQVLKCFTGKVNQFYWLNTLDLVDAEKGFIYLYMGLGRVK